MLPEKPEDWPRLFEQHCNAGNLDAVMVLYEKEARFVNRFGETLVGRDAIRKLPDAFIDHSSGTFDYECFNDQRNH